jgi:hypothetical protein
MTIAAAWVRTLDNGAEELMFCSDSRLCGGKRFDHCQKIFRLARNDAAICFSGGTDWAYPMIVAAISAAGLHLPSETRSLSLPKLGTHIINILNQMQREVHNFATAENIPDVTFIFGGYDWWKKRFRIWRLVFDEDEKKFVADEQSLLVFFDAEKKAFVTDEPRGLGFSKLGKIQIAGDGEWAKKMRERIKDLVTDRYWHKGWKKDRRGAKFDMEPFEVIRDLLKESDANDTIGGAPQGVKIYQYLNSTDIGIFWPHVRDGRLFVSGRPLLDYERATIKSVLDPDSLNSTWASGNTAEAVIQIERAVAADQNRNADEDSSGLEGSD